MKKRITSLFLVLCMLLSMTMTVSFAIGEEATDTVVGAQECDHNHGEGWTLLTDDLVKTTLTDGKYYQTGDVTRSGKIMVSGDVTFCLCGHKIIQGTSSSSNNVMFNSSVAGTKITIKNGSLTAKTANQNYRAVYFTSQADITLENLTIDGFTGNGGSAVTATNTGSSLSITNCVFKNCGREGATGGAVKTSCPTTMSNCIFENNSCASGASIYSTSKDLTISECVFRNNTATSNSAGIYIGSGTASISDTTFSGNSATSNGGAIYQADGTVTISNCQFTGNNADATGNAIRLADGSLTVTDTDFIGNTGHAGSIYLGTGNADLVLNGGNINNNTAEVLSAGIIINGGSTSEAQAIINGTTFDNNPVDDGSTYEVYLAFSDSNEVTGATGAIVNDAFMLGSFKTPNSSKYRITVNGGRFKENPNNPPAGPKTVVGSGLIAGEDGQNETYPWVVGTAYTATVADGIEGGTVTVDPAKSVAGATVTVTATPAQGYELETLTVDGTDIKETKSFQLVADAEKNVVSATFVSTACQHPETEAIGEAKAPTCTEPGITAGVKCSVCGETITAQEDLPVDASAHPADKLITDAAVAPDCDDTGLTEGKHCSACGEVLVAQTVVNATGHDYSNLTTIPATCTEDGWMTITCRTCGETFDSRYDEEFAEYVASMPPYVSITPPTAKGHTEVVDEAVAPTYTSTGLTEGKHCSACGEVLVAQTEVPKLSMGYDQLVAAIAAAGTEPTTIKLYEDIFYSNGYNDKKVIKIEAGQNITLDLNGFTLGQTVVDRGLSAAAIAVRADAVLNIIDTSETQTGKISACSCAVQLEGTLNLQSGTIAIDNPSPYDVGENGFAYGVWFYMRSASAPAPVFNMTGGAIDISDEMMAAHSENGLANAVAFNEGVDGVADYYDAAVVNITVSADKVDGTVYVSQNAQNITVPDGVEVVHYEPWFHVAVAEGIANGTVTVSADWGYEGDTITVTATPDEGYELVAVKVNGEAIEGNVFQMPAEDVEVSAEFKAVEVKDEPMDVEDFKGGETVTAPAKDDHVFAGWYADAECTVPYTENSGKAYAKFVDEKVLSVKAQITANTTAASEYTDLRLISTVDDLTYREVGFKITFKGQSTKVSGNHVYSSIVAKDGGVAYSKAPHEDFSAQSQYFITFTITSIPNAMFSEAFEVTPYWITLDGTEHNGITNTLRIVDGITE